MTEPTLHPDCAHLAFLLGTWQGEGKGAYPTTGPFAYTEEVRFFHLGKPFLLYAQRTWHPEKGFLMHGEMGYWRALPPDRVEIVLVHPTGIAEIQEGTVRGTSIEVASTSVTRTSTAKQIDRLERTFTVEGDVLRYELRMAAVGVPVTPHLAAELRRAAD